MRKKLGVTLLLLSQVLWENIAERAPSVFEGIMIV